MKNQLPTFEEFRSETKKKLKASLYRKGFRLDDINKALDMVCDTNEY